MNILVIGDYISDAYTFASATRLCPEAPVPVLIPEKTRESPGGAGLVQAQLKELGADALGRYGSYSTKQRFFANNHLVCRLDHDAGEGYWDAPIEPSLDWADAIVVSDYGKGAMTRELAHKIVETDLPCFVDAKNHWHWYSGRNVTIFPNEHECLDEIFMADQVVRKLGKNGCDHFNLHLPATVSEVVDVTGAGDIFMASFVYAWSLQLPAEDCLRFANELAGESCRHLGTYVVPREFAQSVLDRLRASQAPAQQAPDLATYSNSPEHLRAQKLYPSVSMTTPIFPVGDNLPANCFRDAVENLMAEGTPLTEQIRRQSPSAPTESTDTPIPSGQDILLEPSGKQPWEG